MMDEVVIFGASGGAVKVAQMLMNLGVEIIFFVDNDGSKHGKTIEGKPVASPEILRNSTNVYKIVIASVYHDEILHQLLDMGIPKDHIILKEEYVMDYINSHMEDLINPTDINSAGQNSGEETIIIDLAEGIVLGGVEKWGVSLAEALQKRKKKVKIFTMEGNIEYRMDRDDSYPIQLFELSHDRYIESIKELVIEIVHQMPCTIVINKINQIFMAASIVKKIFPDHIRIVSVLHSDFTRMYEQNQLVKDELDAVLCVSDNIKAKLISDFHVSENMVYYKNSPVSYDMDFVKEYSKECNPIVVGYGGRLEKAQKRADLLIPLIEKLERKGVDYVLYIAGGGSISNKISNYIQENSLVERVILTGVLPFNKMLDFWKKCDVFINLSEIEGGAGLSALEAMSVGVVPVVTRTSGIHGFIVDGVNGFVNEIGDIDGIVENIFILSKERKKLKEYGDRSREIIKQKCNREEYVDYLVAEIL